METPNPDALELNSPVDEETLRRYRNSSAKEKLEWLEEVNELTEKTLTPEREARRNRLRGSQ